MPCWGQPSLKLGCTRARAYRVDYRALFSQRFRLATSVTLPVSKCGVFIKARRTRCGRRQPEPHSEVECLLMPFGQGLAGLMAESVATCRQSRGLAEWVPFA